MFAKQQLPILLAVSISILCLSLDDVRAADSKSGPQQVRTVGGVKFELEKCQQAGKTVTCSMKATSLGKDRALTVTCTSVAVFTDNGDEYVCATVSIGNKTGASVGRTIVEGIPTPFKITVNGVSSAARAIALLKATLLLNDSGYKTLELRNIPFVD